MRRSSASTYSSVSRSASGGGLSFMDGAGGDRHGRPQDRADVGKVASLALQIVDHDRFGGMIGGRVAQAVQGDRRVAGIVVGLVAGMQSPFFGRTRPIAELLVDER